MLGRRDPQRCLFDVIGLPHTVDPESFYGRMGAAGPRLFRDDDLAGMYCPDNGRPSLPPSLMSGVTLLQFYDDAADGEAVARVKFDLRWKVALNVPNAESALELATAQVDREEVRTAGWLLTKILGDDTEEDGQGKVVIAQGTAPDRIVSITDPEMRHGRKSAAKRFDGFKVSVAIERSSELIMDVADMAASAGDGKQLLPTVARVEEHAQVEVALVIGDGAYPSGDNLAGCAEHPGHPVELVAPMRPPDEARVAKAAFRIDLEARRATCPQGQAVAGHKAKDEKGRPILKFAFERSRCESCPLFNKRVRSKTAGRVVHTHYHEAHLQAARQRQASSEFKEVYRTRSTVERKLAELVEHGLRGTRYIGDQKRRLQRLWTGAAVKLKRLFKLAQERGVQLPGVLSAPDGSRALAKSA